MIVRQTLDVSLSSKCECGMDELPEFEVRQWNDYVTLDWIGSNNFIKYLRKKAFLAKDVQIVWSLQRTIDSDCIYLDRSFAKFDPLSIVAHLKKKMQILVKINEL